MKKVMALFLALLMTAGLMAAFAVTSSAEGELEYVEEVYTFNPLETSEWGNGQNPIAGGLWRFDYYDRTTGNEGYYPMRGWEGSGPNDGTGGANNYFEPLPDLKEGNTSEDPYFFCRHRNTGLQLHPGTHSDPVRTFIVPANGTIAFEATVTHAGASVRGSSESAGDEVSVWLNDDTCIWPTSDHVDGDRITAESVEAHYVLVYSGEAPTQITINNLQVKAGDEIHLRVAAHMNLINGKAVQVDNNTVTYLTCDLPIGASDAPPASVSYRDLTSSSVTLAWDEARNAAGYNVYLNGDKITDAPITTTSLELTDLEPGTIYRFTVTSVAESGDESEPSEEILVRTPKESAVPNNPGSSSVDPNNDPSATQSDTSSDAASSTNIALIFMIAVPVLVVVVVAVIVVAVLVSKKKKTTDE